MSELSDIVTMPNPDLVVGDSGRPFWNTPENRRWGWHNLHRIARYAVSLRSRDVLRLHRDIDLRIAGLPAVARLTGMDCFSAMAVVRGDRLLFERYAPDFGPERPHSIMSVTKVMVNLIFGRLIDQGLVDLSSRIKDYLPEIGSGYAEATLKDVLRMNVVNDYSENSRDPMSSSFLEELSLGLRVPGEGQSEVTNREFLCAIESDDVANPTGGVLYKSANSGVAGWVAERASERPLIQHVIDIVEAAGLEGTLYISTDREGAPNLNGGASMSARDLARLGLLFVRGGTGIHGEAVGSRDFIDASRNEPGAHYPPPREWMKYGFHLMTNGRWVGHGGYAGQYMLANPETGVVVAFLGAVENARGSDIGYNADIVLMAETISELPFDD